MLWNHWHQNNQFVFESGTSMKDKTRKDTQLANSSKANSPTVDKNIVSDFSSLMKMEICVLIFSFMHKVWAV